MVETCSPALNYRDLSFQLLPASGEVQGRVHSEAAITETSAHTDGRGPVILALAGN